jgi:hypothetical protein
MIALMSLRRVSVWCVWFCQVLTGDELVKLPFKLSHG